MSSEQEEIMLFGVRVKVDPMRKSVSMNNLSQYQQHPLNNTDSVKAPEDGAAAVGYASADDAVPLPSNGTRDRKRGVPWTEEEHKQFLVGLQKVGKGDWRGISRNYVKTRTPTQVASHAQKYFLRRTNINRRRRRSSLFDITTDSVTAMPIGEVRSRQESAALPPAVAPNINGFSVVPFPVLLSMQGGNVMENAVRGQSDQVNNSSSMMVMPSPVLPLPTSSTMMVDFNLNRNVPTERFPLSLNLSLSSGQDQSSTRDSVIPSFNGDNLLTVA